jgi:hypothetical protein
MQDRVSSKLNSLQAQGTTTQGSCAPMVLANHAAQFTSGQGRDCSDIPFLPRSHKVSGIQPKLMINAPDIPPGQAADRSEHLVGTWSANSIPPNVPILHRKCATCASHEEDDDKTLQRRASSSSDDVDVSSSGSLRISSPNDPAELEADRVAAEVMRMPAPSNSTVLQRKCTACEDEEKVHRSATSQSSRTAPSIVNQVLSQPGQPLADSTRSFFEPRLGVDLSAVRVHTDAQAARSADAVHAKAYTVGNNIAFANGEYAPQSETGKGLLAHELVHVVQRLDRVHREPDAPAGMTSGADPASVVAPPSADSESPKMDGQDDQSDAETLEKIAAILKGNFWVGPLQELRLETLWKTFQGRLTGLLRNNANVTKLFIESVDRGAEIEYLGDVDAIRKRFLSDITETAKKYMDANDSLITNEVERLGLKQLGPLFTDTQRGGIDEIQKAAPKFKLAEIYKAQILSIPVGYEYETISDGLGHITIKNEVAFNPTKPPAIPNTGTETPPKPTWEQTNTEYLKAESVLSGLKIKYPALAALQAGGGVDAAIGTDPIAARAAILKAFGTVQGNIARTRERIATLDLNPLNLQPIHAQLFAGQKGPSMTAWNGQYDQWVAKELISHHDSVEFWKAMGIGSAAAAAFIIAEFATAGWATVFVASGVALSGVQAADSWEKYLAVADASKTALNDKQNIVGSGQASEALISALLDSVFFFLDAYSAAAKGVKGAAKALERGGVKATSREAAEEETKRLIEKEGREAAKGARPRLPGFQACRLGSLYCSLEFLHEEFASLFKSRDSSEFAKYLRDIPERDLNLARSLRQNQTILTGDAMYAQFLGEVPRGEWTAAFRNAVDRARVEGVDFRRIVVEGENLRWPLDEVGTPWVVHHDPPLGWVTAEGSELWHPMPYRIHDAAHAWWSQFQAAVVNRLRESGLSTTEIREIIGGDIQEALTNY